MSADQSLDELLNSYLDGELPETRRVQVERLMASDPEAAARLRQLGKCKALVSGLPRLDPPSDTASQVLAVLERRSLLGQDQAEVRPQVRHVVFRRLSAVAAVLVLGMVLSGMVYVIMAPTDRVPDLASAGKGTPQESGLPGGPGVFACRLELACTQDTYAGFVRRALETLCSSKSLSVEDLTDRKVYRITCTREAAAGLAQELGTVWHAFGSPTFHMQTGQFGRTLAVHDIRASQVADLLNQADAGAALSLAREMAVGHGIKGLVESGPRVAVMRSLGLPEIPSVAKPMLTSRDPSVRAEERVTPGNRVDLTIVLITPPKVK